MKQLIIIANNGAQDGVSQFLVSMVPFILIFAIFYWLLIRPQRKREAERQQMIQALKKNDRVVTTGGIFGTVASVREKDILLRVDDANNVRIRVTKSAIAALLKESGEKEDGHDSEP